MPYRKIADIALLAGQIMLESNAETYRVEETMEYILKITNFETTEAFVLTTGLMVTLDDSSIEAITIMKRIKQRSVNLGKIHYVNDISRQLVKGTLSIDDAYSALLAIEETPYSLKETYIANIILAMAFTVMVGGDFYEMLVSFINTCLLMCIWHIFQHQNGTLFMRNVLSCTMIGMISSISIHLFPHLSLNAIIFGSVMPMVPGTLITNAIRDTFKGDFTSGVARTLETLLVGFSIALGIAAGVMISGGGIYL